MTAPTNRVGHMAKAMLMLYPFLRLGHSRDTAAALAGALSS